MANRQVLYSATKPIGEFAFSAGEGEGKKKDGLVPYYVS